MSDGRAEGRLGFGAFWIDVDPLMILGCISEIVYVRLRDFEQVAHADFLPDEGFEFFHT
jgi:hypothetical protein